MMRTIPTKMKNHVFRFIFMVRYIKRVTLDHMKYISSFAVTVCFVGMDPRVYLTSLNHLWCCVLIYECFQVVVDAFPEDVIFWQ